MQKNMKKWNIFCIIYHWKSWVYFCLFFWYPVFNFLIESVVKLGDKEQLDSEQYFIHSEQPGISEQFCDAKSSISPSLIYLVKHAFLPHSLGLFTNYVVKKMVAKNWNGLNLKFDLISSCNFSLTKGSTNRRLPTVHWWNIYVTIMCHNDELS